MWRHFCGCMICQKLEMRVSGFTSTVCTSCINRAPAKHAHIKYSMETQTEPESQIGIKHQKVATETLCCSQDITLMCYRSSLQSRRMMKLQLLLRCF